MQGFASSAAVLEEGRAAWFKQPGCWHEFSIFFLLLTPRLVTPALVPKAPALKKTNRPSAGRQQCSSHCKKPSYTCKEGKTALPRRKPTWGHPGCTTRTPIPHRASSKAHHRPATCSGRHRVHWLRSGSERTLSQVGAEEQKIKHNVPSTCILKTKQCELAARLGVKSSKRVWSYLLVAGHELSKSLRVVGKTLPQRANVGVSSFWSYLSFPFILFVSKHPM